MSTPVAPSAADKSRFCTQILQFLTSLTGLNTDNTMLGEHKFTMNCSGTGNAGYFKNYMY